MIPLHNYCRQHTQSMCLEPNSEAGHCPVDQSLVELLAAFFHSCQHILIDKSQQTFPLSRLEPECPQKLWISLFHKCCNSLMAKNTQQTKDRLSDTHVKVILTPGQLKINKPNDIKCTKHRVKDCMHTMRMKSRILDFID